MPRRNLLTPAERTGLLAFPATDDELISLARRFCACLQRARRARRHDIGCVQAQ